LSFSEEHVVALRELQKQCEIEMMGWDPPQEYLDEWARTVLGLYQQDPNLVKIAVVEDKVVGYCIMVKKLYNHEGVVMDVTWNTTYIWDLFVAKEHRNKGIGTKLLNEAIGCDKTGLLVNYQNERAKKLFEKAGFKLYNYYLMKRF
jgi:ribosomal protein S18 acetylase RimI-like enzyme